MKIISIATQKGGAGKTTIATNLAVALTKGGRNNVLIIDADSKQKTAIDWFNKRTHSENPIAIECDSQTSLEKVVSIAEGKGINFIVIDTQGADTNLVNAVIKSSDFTLIPCKSGGFDVGAQRATAAAIKKLEKNAAFVITQAPSRGREVDETKSILRGLGLPICDHHTSLLKAYKDAALFSSSVIEDNPKSKASSEIKSICKWLEKALERNKLLESIKEEAVHG